MMWSVLLNMSQRDKQPNSPQENLLLHEQVFSPHSLQNIQSVPAMCQYYNLVVAPVLAFLKAKKSLVQVSQVRRRGNLWQVQVYSSHNEMHPHRIQEAAVTEVLSHHRTSHS